MIKEDGLNPKDEDENDFPDDGENNFSYESPENAKQQIYELIFEGFVGPASGLFSFFISEDDAWKIIEEQWNKAVKEALAEGIKPEDLFKYDFIERVSNEVQESAFAKDRELRERMLAQRDLSGLDPDCGEPVNSSGKADANESLKETLFGRRPKSN